MTQRVDPQPPNDQPEAEAGSPLSRAARYHADLIRRGAARLGKGVARVGIPSIVGAAGAAGRGIRALPIPGLRGGSKTGEAQKDGSARNAAESPAWEHFEHAAKSRQSAWILAAVTASLAIVLLLAHPTKHWRGKRRSALTTVAGAALDKPSSHEKGTHHAHRSDAPSGDHSSADAAPLKSAAIAAQATSDNSLASPSGQTDPDALQPLSPDKKTGSNDLAGGDKPQSNPSSNASAPAGDFATNQEVNKPAPSPIADKSSSPFDAPVAANSTTASQPSNAADTAAAAKDGPELTRTADAQGGALPPKSGDSGGPALGIGSSEKGDASTDKKARDLNAAKTEPEGSGGYVPTPPTDDTKGSTPPTHYGRHHKSEAADKSAASDPFGDLRDPAAKSADKPADQPLGNEMKSTDPTPAGNLHVPAVADKSAPAPARGLTPDLQLPADHGPADNAAMEKDRPAVKSEHREKDIWGSTRSAGDKSATATSPFDEPSSKGSAIAVPQEKGPLPGAQSEPAPAEKTPTEKVPEKLPPEPIRPDKVAPEQKPVEKYTRDNPFHDKHSEDKSPADRSPADKGPASDSLPSLSVPNQSPQSAPPEKTPLWDRPAAGEKPPLDEKAASDSAHTDKHPEEMRTDEAHHDGHQHEGHPDEIHHDEARHDEPPHHGDEHVGDKLSGDKLGGDKLGGDKLGGDKSPLEAPPAEKSSSPKAAAGNPVWDASSDKGSDKGGLEKIPVEKLPPEKLPPEKLPPEKLPPEKLPPDKLPAEKQPVEKLPGDTSLPPELNSSKGDTGQGPQPKVDPRPESGNGGAPAIGLDTGKPADEPQRSLSVSLGAPSASDAPGANVSFARRPNESVGIGPAFAYKILVRNNGNRPVAVVEVEEAIPPRHIVQSTDPPADAGAESLHWSVPNLGPHEERTLTITLVPPLEHSAPDGREKSVPAAAVAPVSSGSAAEPEGTEIKLAGPNAGANPANLQLEIVGPKTIAVGETCRLGFRATNMGPQSRGLKVYFDLPKELRYSRGQQLQCSVGTLDQGESREDYLTAVAASPGVVKVRGEILSAKGRLLSAEATVHIVAGGQNGPSARRSAYGTVVPAGASSIAPAAVPTQDPCNCWP